MILMFYLIGNNIHAMVIGYVLLSFLSAYVECAIYIFQNAYMIWGEDLNILQCLFLKYRTVWRIIIGNNNGLRNLDIFFFQSRSIVALIPIYVISKFEGKVKLNKYIGYLFYPLHMTILILIQLLITKVM